MTDKLAALVLCTINAPYRSRIDAATLAACIRSHDAARKHAGPMSSFFLEVSEQLRIEFAESRGIPKADLDEATRLFKNWAGYK